MAIDNSLYDSLESTYTKIKNYLDTTTLGREHSTMIMKQEELSSLLATLDIEAIEEQWSDIEALHEKLNAIKEISNKILQNLNDTADSVSLTTKVVDGLDEVFLKVSKVSV